MRDGWARTLWRMGALTAVLAAAGCAGSQPPPQAAAPPPSITLGDDDYQSFKTAYLAANPAASVGRVQAVLPGDQRLAVGDLNTGSFRKGDILSIVDEKLAPLADGTVVAVDKDLVYVRYEPVTVGSRAPTGGDLAIRAETPKRSD
jgi:hypothetical protein